MISIWHDAMPAFAVEFPPLLHSLLFWIFSSLVVHVCQRLVEHTAFSVDPSSRRISASHAALCIGCIVWALDVVGLFMYTELAHQTLELVPALSGLIIMAVSARFTIPTLSTSTSKARIVLAGAWLAVGMLVAHFSITWDHVQSFSQINWLAIAMSMVTAVGIATYTSIRHRSAKLSVVTPHFRTQTWEDRVLCGAAILVLHWMLINTFALREGAPGEASESIALIVIVLVFAIAVAVEQMSNMRSDANRQQLLRRGLAMMRSSGVAQNAQHDMQLSLIADHLHRLLRSEKLTLHFQPIVDTQQRTTQFEALLRMTDELLGSISPETFLLVCELQGKTVEVDRMILCNALDGVKAWQAHGLTGISISVNIAPITLLDDSFVPWLRDELALRALPPRTLKLEITEHAIIAMGSEMVAAIHDLATMDVAVVMDDFGAGYSSLGILADLPIAGIKCDRLFVRNLSQDRRRQMLLQHISALASSLGLSVVVEGVETLEELRTLTAVGLHCIQGYLFSKPLPADEVPAWYQSQMQSHRAAMQDLRHPSGTAAAAHPSFQPSGYAIPCAPGA